MLLAATELPMDPIVLLVIVGVVLLICLVLCSAAFLASRKARDLNFTREENVNRLTEKATGADMKVSQLELKIAQVQQRLDLEYLTKLQDTVEKDPRHYPDTSGTVS